MAGSSRRYPDVRIAHIRCWMLAGGGSVERDFRKREEQKFADSVS